MKLNFLMVKKKSKIELVFMLVTRKTYKKEFKPLHFKNPKW